MAIDYNALGKGSIAKGPPAGVLKDRADAAWQKVDEKESAKVRRRSNGRCEVRLRGRRCMRRAFEVHHHIGGWRQRGRGASALAANKTHACTTCHGRIESNRYRHIRGNHYAEA